MAEEIGVSHKVVRTSLERFASGQMVVTDGAQGKNIITICNYDKYQASEKDKGTARAQQGHTKGTREQYNNLF
ncbi:MAG: hypothetical protein ABJC87_08470 [Roseobacter sp.]